MAKLHPFTIRLDAETEAIISNAAKAAHKSKSEFCREIFRGGYKQMAKDFQAEQPAPTVERPRQEDMATAEQVQKLREEVAQLSRSLDDMRKEQDRGFSDFWGQRTMITDIYIMLEAFAAIMGNHEEFNTIRDAMLKENGREDLAYFYADEEAAEARAFEAVEKLKEGHAK